MAAFVKQWYDFFQSKKVQKVHFGYILRAVLLNCIIILERLKNSWQNWKKYNNTLIIQLEELLSLNMIPSSRDVQNRI